MTQAGARSFFPAARGVGPLYAGVFLVAMSALLLEVALTRVFAVMMWHHFAYMIVSLALLGFGAAGSILTVLRIGQRRADPRPLLAAFATSYGVSIVLCFLLGTRMHVDTIEILQHPANFLRLMLLYLILSLPFLFCGLVIGASLSCYPERVGILYCFDLVGSAAGGALAPWLLGQLHTGAVIMVAALIALLAGAVFALGSPRGRRIAHALPALAGAWLVAGFAGGGFGVPPIRWEIPFDPQKIMAKSFFANGQLEASLPSATAQVDISRAQTSRMRMAADFGARDGQKANMRMVTQDGTAPTVLYQDARDVARFTGLADSQASTAFLANGAAGRKDPEVLVVGVGGGVDVMIALSFGASKVTAVEINPAMIDMVTRRYAGYLGNLFSDPRVRLLREEGRAFIKRTPERYDVIQISGTDTYTALSSGVYTSSEAYLYTVEAVMDMYARLKPGGYINYSRIMLSVPDKPQRETLRLANVARTALARLGVTEPSRNIAIFQGINWASTMLRKGPFTGAEVARLRDFAAAENFYGLVFDPLRPTAAVTDNGEACIVGTAARRLVPPAVLKGETGKSALAHLQIALRSVLHGDSRQADAATQLAAADLAPPAQQATGAPARGGGGQAAVAGIRAQLAYRQALAAAYQTVLSAPAAEQRRYVARYPYDIRPPSDDKPFFFDYYKLGTLRHKAPAEAILTEFLPDFPVGHLVLASSLIQLVVWAALLILLPLRALPKAAAAPAQKLRIFTYFAMLGCGFMFVEISLMQKLVLFLGHPTYSLSVVLSSLLAFSGLGALCSSRIENLSGRALPTALAAALGLLLLDRFGLDPVLAQAMSLEWPLRVLLTVLILAPTGFALGFPFPLGIRLLREQAPALIPWGWAVNGFLSVAGSLLAVMLAMTAGFSTVLLAAAASYLVALLVIPVRIRSEVRLPQRAELPLLAGEPDADAVG
jgi:hypothetical protein